MKNNGMMKLAAFMLIAVALTTCTVSTTFAKYTSTSTGTDSARVAKWAVTINDEDVVANDEFTINLFEDTFTNVQSAGSDKVIAPGTEGSFDLVIKNASEVLAGYTVDYTVTNQGNIPIKFSVDGTNWTDDLADITTAQNVAMGSSATIKVQWKWDETSSDSADTTLGAAGTATVEVKAAITVSQIVE